MMESNQYIDKTIIKYVKNGLCCQTGICASICPQNAIIMNYDKNGYLYPQIIHEKCILCGKCLSVCPVNKDYLFNNLRKNEEYKFDKAYGSYKSIYTGYSKNKIIRQNASSGGLLTHLLVYLLKSKIVDAVITAKDQFATINGPWSKITAITNPEELFKTQSSKYYPLSYDRYLEYVSKYERVAVVGIPCVIYGLKKLEKYNNRKNDLYISTVCSHNTSTKFGTTLFQEQGFNNSDICLINFRDKTNIPAHNQYNNKFITLNYSDNSIEKIKIINRFRNSFTFLWRNYFFAKKSCLFCPDFSGYMADISFADAWNTSYVSDPVGNSLVIVRNEEIDNILQQLAKNEILLRNETIDTARNAQAIQVNFKAEDYSKRVKLKDNLLISDLSILIDYYLKLLAIKIGKTNMVNKLWLIKSLYACLNLVKKGIVVWEKIK